MFKVGDRVRVKINASDSSIDYRREIRGGVYTVSAVTNMGVLLEEISWWASPLALVLDFTTIPTKEEKVLKKIAHLYKLFDERNKNVESN